MRAVWAGFLLLPWFIPLKMQLIIHPSVHFLMPVRSRYGYHLITVNAIRPALGEIKLAHIMIRAGRNDDPETDVTGKGKDL